MNLQKLVNKNFCNFIFSHDVNLFNLCNSTKSKNTYHIEKDSSLRIIYYESSLRSLRLPILSEQVLREMDL